MKRILITIIHILFAVFMTAQEQKATFGDFALIGATVHTVTKGTLENATVLISNGNILDVGTSVTIPDNFEKIDCSEKHVYPGMTDAGCGLGLYELGSISLTRDRREIGDFTPHMRALTAVNPNSVHMAITRVNGVTSALSVPQGGMFPGTADLINLHGYTPQQMYSDFSAIVMNYPSTGKWGRWDRRSEEDIKKDDEKKLKKFKEIWAKADNFARIDSAGQRDGLDYNPEMDQLLAVLKGEKHLLINVNKEKDIKSALEWIDEIALKNVIFAGVKEGWRVADEIAKSEIPCIVGPILSLPSRAYDDYDIVYKNASILHKAGVLIAIQTSEDENVRNLPFHAGFAATYGLGTDAALEAVTINPAKIFGISDKVGSIEAGKWANLFVSDGDPFETKTQISHLFIRGYKIAIDNRQIRLYEEFLERDPGVQRAK